MVHLWNLSLWSRAGVVRSVCPAQLLLSWSFGYREKSSLEAFILSAPFVSISGLQHSLSPKPEYVSGKIIKKYTSISFFESESPPLICLIFFHLLESSNVC